jgi:uncharacterized protein
MIFAERIRKIKRSQCNIGEFMVTKISQPLVPAISPPVEPCAAASPSSLPTSTPTESTISPTSKQITMPPFQTSPPATSWFQTGTYMLQKGLYYLYLSNNPEEIRISAHRQNAIQNNDAESQCQLGLYHLDKSLKSLERSKSFDIEYRYNYMQAEEWFQKAADQGHTEAEYQLGCLMYKMAQDLHCLERDEFISEKAARLLTKAAEKGHVGAQYQLGLFEEVTKRGSYPGETPSEWMEKAANQGHIQAQNSMGDFYLDHKNYVEAVKWYQKAAEQGNSSAQYALSFCYIQGIEGIPQDDNEAVKWAQKAAEQKNAQAQHLLGVCYLTGRGGLQKNEVEAASLFQKAADQELVHAQYDLGICFYEGRGIIQNTEEALKWIDKAANQDLNSIVTRLRKRAQEGTAEDQYLLGLFYYEGKGKDYQQAFQWFLKAAEQCDAKAYCYLGLCYYRGHGVSRQESQASVCFEQAKTTNIKALKKFMEKFGWGEIGAFISKILQSQQNK